MNRKLSDARLHQICIELLGKNPLLSGRQLRTALRECVGAACRTDRVYAVWRELRAGQGRAVIANPAPSADLNELTTQLHAARRRIQELEAVVMRVEQRAVNAEERERIHQERWAAEIDLLRQAVRLRR